MIVPFGFSVGDFITVIQFTKDAISSLQAQGGAVDSCLSVVNELEANILIFQELEKLDLPPKYEAQQRSIVALAQGLNGSATSFFECVQKYSKKFARPGSYKYHHATLSKAQWVTKMEHVVAQHRAEVESRSLSLRLLLLKVNVDISMLVFKDSQEFRQGYEKDQQLSVLRHQELTSRMHTMQRSIGSIEAQERTIISVLRLITNSIQVGVSTPQIEAGNYARRSVLMRPSTTSMVSGLGHVTRTFEKEAANSPPAALDLLHTSQENISSRSSSPRNGSISPRSSAYHRRYFQPHHALTERKAVARAPPSTVVVSEALLRVQMIVDVVAHQEGALKTLSAGFHHLLQVLVCLYPHIVLLMMWFWTIPASVSRLTSDNIVFEDFFGRTHHLPYQYFRDWSMVQKMLETQMKDTPGSWRIQNHRFVLEVWKGRRESHLLYPRDWNSEIKPGAKVTMAAALKTLRMSIGTCTRCKGPVRMMLDCYFRCAACNITYRTWSSADTSSLHRVLRQARTSGSVHLHEPWNATVPRRQGWESYSFRHKVLKYRIYETHQVTVEHFVAPQFRAANDKNATKRLALLSTRSLGNPETLAKTLSTHVQTTPIRGSRTKINWRTSPGAPNPIDREEEELNIYRRVSLRENAPLHSAALAGDETLVRALLINYANPDDEKGIYGSPLSAAVLSGSTQVVELLLNHGASPLKTHSALPGPIELAASRNQTLILDVLLTRARELLGLNIVDHFGYQAHNTTVKRNMALRKIFHVVLDSALVAATCDSALDTVQLLLFYGANMYSKVIDGRSPFKIALARPDKDLLETFIVETTSRSLLTLDEAKSTVLSDRLLRLFEDGVQQRMMARSQWHFPYYHGMPFADETDLETVNRQFAAWVNEKSPTSAATTFAIPHVVVNDEIP